VDWRVRNWPAGQKLAAKMQTSPAAETERESPGSQKVRLPDDPPGHAKSGGHGRQRPLSRYLAGGQVVAAGGQALALKDGGSNWHRVKLRAPPGQTASDGQGRQRPLSRNSPGRHHVLTLVQLAEPGRETSDPEHAVQDGEPGVAAKKFAGQAEQAVASVDSDVRPAGQETQRCAKAVAGSWLRTKPREQTHETLPASGSEPAGQRRGTDPTPPTQ
jgi:hypothetical protein